MKYKYLKLYFSIVLANCVSHSAFSHGYLQYVLFVVLLVCVPVSDLFLLQIQEICRINILHNPTIISNWWRSRVSTFLILKKLNVVECAALVGVHALSDCFKVHNLI